MTSTTSSPQSAVLGNDRSDAHGMEAREQGLTRRDYTAFASILAVNLAVRGLELSERGVSPYFVLSDAMVRSPWRLLLPLDIGDGYSRWSTTGLSVVALLQTVVSTSTIFLVFNVALIVGSFYLAWRCTGSRPFSYALAACSAVTTQYHWTYMNAGVLPLYLMSLYLLWQLAAYVWLVWKGAPGAPRHPRAVFVTSLVVLALSWEQWLDYWLFGLCVSGLLFLVAPRQPRIQLRELRWSTLVLAITGVFYIAVKLATATEHGTPGKESELVLGYLLRDGIGVRQGAILAAEDMISNFFTYSYFALTNFLPPALLPGQSLNNLSIDALVATQRGYHPQMAHLVGYHHVFLWYLFAGALTTLLGVLTAWAVRRALREGDGRALLLAAGGLLVLVGSATHILIKYRPYLSEPFLQYKAGVAITGASVLFAFLFALAWQRRGRLGRRALAIGGSVILLWGAFTRPTSLSGMSSRLQMGNLPSPDPVEPAIQAVHRHYKPTKQRILRALGL